MEQADALYRAFVEYRKVTKGNISCARTREAIRVASAEGDRLETVSSRCIIKEDWVNKIYEGLEYVGKAIAEERQFIRQQGEVVPIEKVRRVSKGSVEHLAKHSELLTHEPEEGAKLIPDKLFMVERLSDYTVYENRFLYMLLCYLRDFIEIRYSKIIELGNTYRAELDTDKEITVGKRTITYKATFREQSKVDPYGLTADSGSGGLLQRIEEERHLVAAYLMTPLMKKVAEAPLLKPPVTRTNALRMDVNFKGALELYDYVVAYDSDGYTIEYDRKEINPFSERIGDEFAEFVSMTAFFTYKFGRDMSSRLEEAYQAEERRRAEEREQEQLRQLNELRKRIAEGCGDPEQYMLMLEERNAKLEKLIPQLAEAKKKITELEGTLRELRQKQTVLLNTIDELKEENAKKDAEMHEMTIRHQAEIERIKSEAEQRLAKVIEEHNAEMTRFKTECEEKLKTALAEGEARMNATIAENEAKTKAAIAESENKMKTAIAESEAKMNKAVTECAEKVSTAEGALSELREKHTIACAELLAQRQMNGNIPESEDFTERERFEELEREYLALSKLIESEWKKTKKKIRKRVLWKKFD